MGHEMKKIHIFTLLFMLLFFMFAGNAMAGYYTFQSQEDSDLGDLDHYKAYKWIINWDIPENETISSAQLVFDDIYDSVYKPYYYSNAFYGNLLSSAYRSPYDITGYGDLDVYNDYNWGNSNFFANYPGEHSQLFAWYNKIDGTPQDLVYNFSSTEIGLLSYYASDGNFGLGFDPDCHFNNNGVTLIIETDGNENPVPEPATMLMLGTGLLGFSGFIRFRKKK